MINLHDWDLDDIANWPRRAQCVALSCAVAALLIAAHFFYLSPKLAQLERLKQQELRSTTQLITRAAQTRQWAELTASLDLEQQRYLALSRQMSTDKELARVLDELSRIAQQQQLVIQRMVWGQWQTQTHSQRLALDLQLQGDYHAISQFMATTTGLPQMMVFEQLNWQRSAPSSTQIKLRARAYLYQFLPEVADEK